MFSGQVVIDLDFLEANTMDEAREILLEWVESLKSIDTDKVNYKELPGCRSIVKSGDF